MKNGRNHMKKLLLMCLIFFFPINLYGKDFVNKGLICENFQKGFIFTPVIGFWFEKNNIVSLLQQTNEGWYDGIKGTYEVQDFSISILIQQPNLYMGNFSIDRNNGKLKHTRLEFMCDEVWDTKINFKLGLNKRLENAIDRKNSERKKKDKEYQQKLDKRKF